MEVALGNFGFGIIQEKILTNRIHMHYGAGYSVWATEEESCHRGGGGCGGGARGGWMEGQGD